MMEESVAAVADDDGDDDDETNYYSNNVRRKENQCKGFSHYRPSNHRKRRTQNMRKNNLEDGLEREDSIRKQVVSKS